MPKSSHSVVVYKPDSQSTDEFMVYVDSSQYRKWKDGDTSIPLVEVVDSYNVFHTGQGVQGLQQTPSKQQLETIFGTSIDVDVVDIILKKGRQQSQKGDLDSKGKGVSSLNPTRGSSGLDRGKGLSGI